ncbi:MAG: hypothetical protein HY319_02490 [Armatimonadetes bacterium]|nr:hypothetical protein [Armatimonadota bacterium]
MASLTALRPAGGAVWVRFDPNVVNEVISLGSVLEWTVMNTSGAFHPHPIHIQPFQVVAVTSPKPRV